MGVVDESFTLRCRVVQVSVYLDLIPRDRSICPTAAQLRRTIANP